MAGKWTPEHRAAYEATVRARRAGPIEPKVADPGVVTVLHADLTEMRAAVEKLGSTHSVADVAERIRQIALRIDDRLALLVVDRQTDPNLLAAFRAINARMAALEATMGRRDDRIAELLKLARRADSRPPRVIEYRPVHRRESEGGKPVRKQRTEVGLPKRPPKAREVG